MADKTWQSSPLLIEELLARGHEFSFEQVMRLARVALGPDKAAELPEDGWHHEDGGHDRPSVRPDLSLAFPAADVARVERAGEDEAGLLVTTTFLGLYGSSSPLPTHYTEDLLDEVSSDSSVSRDFLDIIHQRLYQLYCQCWSKYRLFIRVAEEKNPRDRERLLCLIGLGEREVAGSVPDAWSLVRYAGLLTQRPRSAEGLQTLLRDALGIRSLHVEQCVPRRAPIPPDQRTSLGISGVHLGIDTVVGSEMTDRMGKFRIHLGPLSKADFDLLLPGTLRHDKLVRLVRLYVTDPLDFDLRISLAAGELRPLSLGDPSRPALGMNTWCFSGGALGEQSVTLAAVRGAVPAQTPGSARADLPADLSAWADETQAYTLADYFQEELARLRELARSYAQSHPELASLVHGNPADASVEQLFEGVAFLNAHLRQKLDDDWPEMIHDVVSAIEPNDLRPIPSTTIMVFSPRHNCGRPQLIPSGTEVKSIPIEGTACRFTTRWPVEIHPLVLTNGSFSHPAGKPPTILLTLKLVGLRLDEWNPKSLRLFLAGEYEKASKLYLVLMQYLKRIVIAPLEEGQLVTLAPTHLKPVGFDDSQRLFPSEALGTAGHHMIHEFSILPEKFLFLDLQGWETWSERGKGTEFEIRFELRKPPFELDPVSRGDFVLFATPAINTFKHPAEPITIAPDHLTYPVLPADGNPGCCEAYSVERVTGIRSKSSGKIPFAASHMGHPDPDPDPASSYHLKWEKGALHDEIHLSITSTAAPLAEINTLSIDLACTNGELPERLHIGDVCHGTDNSPTFADFSNCKPVTRREVRSRENNNLWRRLSSRSMNLSLLDAKVLRAMLKSASGSSSDGCSRASNRANPADGIAEVRVMPMDRLMEGPVQRGWEITIAIRDEQYISPGDLYLFGAVLDRFLNGFATQSSFTKVIIEGEQGERYQWPAKTGQRPVV